MSNEFPIDVLAPYRERLTAHPLYGALESIEDLRVFMAHHVFSVWDFMSVIKYLQNELAPTVYPWAPSPHREARRFINELVIEEESDEGLPGPNGEPAYCSHFELYTEAMTEIGADPAPVLAFVKTAFEQGIETAFATRLAPAPAEAFMRRTFGFIASDRPHVVAAVFALGREHIIPFMFREFLGRMGIGETEAPVFHYYLKRHIHLDADHHGPLSLKMLNGFCNGDPVKLGEAERAAKDAIEARISLWDGVRDAVESARKRAAE